VGTLSNVNHEKITAGGRRTRGSRAPHSLGVTNCVLVSNGSLNPGRTRSLLPTLLLLIKPPKGTREQLEAVSARCLAHGIPRPAGFAYPGNVLGLSGDRSIAVPEAV
jgi:hypothetical protein